MAGSNKPNSANIYLIFDPKHDLPMRNKINFDLGLQDSAYKIVGDSDTSQKDRFAASSCPLAQSDVAIVLCSSRSISSPSIKHEIKKARLCGIPYFILQDNPEDDLTLPDGADSKDKIYLWSPENLRLLLAGQR